MKKCSPAIFEQQAFLANSTNKDNFIQLLMSHLSHEGCKTIQSEGDADTDIVKEALMMASKQQGSVAVVGDDTDLLVFLTHHLTCQMFGFGQRPKELPESQVKFMENLSAFAIYREDLVLAFVSNFSLCTRLVDVILHLQYSAMVKGKYFRE